MNASTICPHCREPIPLVLDAFCPHCNERLDEAPNVEIELEPTSLNHPLDVSGLTAEMRIDSNIELPAICVLCGQESERFQKLRVQARHEVKRFMVLNFVGNVILNLGMGRIVARLFGNLLADETFEEKLLDLRLPICSEHEMHDLSAILQTKLAGGKSRPSSAIIANLHPGFVDGAKRFISKRWESLET
jgi:hypothetical protein